jgi:phosphoglycerate dehydrogenase-like enzyme
LEGRKRRQSLTSGFSRDQAPPVAETLHQEALMFKDESISSLAGPSAPEAKPSRRVPVEGEIGFLGLGHMGTALAANLIAAGHRVTAYVRHADQMDKLATLGIDPTMQFADLFDSEIVVSMLPDDAAVRDVVFGQEGADAEGLASGLKRGAIP